MNETNNELEATIALTVCSQGGGSGGGSPLILKRQDVLIIQNG